MAACRRLSVALGACGIDGLQTPFEFGQRGDSALPRHVLDAVRGVGDSVFEIPDDPVDIRDLEHAVTDARARADL